MPDLLEILPSCFCQLFFCEPVFLLLLSGWFRGAGPFDKLRAGLRPQDRHSVAVALSGGAA